MPEFPHPPSGGCTFHPTSSERNAAKSLPPLMASTAGTFSHTSHLASVLSASRTNSMARLPRGSAIPPRFPPEENDWQGVPPTRRSMSPSYLTPPFVPVFSFPSSLFPLPSILVKSPRFGTSGNLCFKTSDANGSVSETNTQRQPRGRHATVAASIPLHTLPYRMAAPSFPSSGNLPTASARRKAAKDLARSNRQGTGRIHHVPHYYIQLPSIKCDDYFHLF